MIRVDFTLDELNTVASALAQRPYLEVYKVIEKITAAVAATPPDQVQQVDSPGEAEAPAPVNRAARRRKARTQAAPPAEVP